jgi:hypothetical protein
MKSHARILPQVCAAGEGGLIRRRGTTELLSIKDIADFMA